MGKRVSLEKKPIDQKPLPHASLDTPPVGEGDSRPPAPETAPNVQDRQTPPPRRPTVVQDRPGATPVQVRVGKMWKRKPIDTEEVNVTVSPLRWRTTFVLALFGGWLGLHRFYLKRYFSAMLFPFLAFGIFMCGYATPYFQKPGSMAIFHAVLILAGLSATFEFFATINNGFVAARGKEPRSSTWTGLLFGGKEIGRAHV